ncbi:MAG: C40 family peptidase [Lachnospiraceae bacterium]|nr:C40 family peptidase [Lachnospiraceae bacterium]MDY5869892.1 NlpC/P60 family protein [Lachnospiraceae bacterium]
MRKKLVRLFAILIAFSMMVLVVEPVRATTISDLEKEKQELEQKKKEADEKKKQEQEKYDNASGRVDTIQSDVDEIAGEIDEIDAALVETLASVELIEEDIADKEEQIEVTTAEYEAAKATEEEQYEAMKLRVKFMYEKGDTTYLQLLLESSGFSDMINKVEYIEKLYEYDRTLLAEYVAARTAAQELKDKLEEEKAELEAQQHELEEEKESLEIILAEKQQTYDNYEVQLAQAKQEAAVYKANIKKQNDEIKKLEAATAAKQSEIDAAKKAEEEARKAQELALQKQAQESGSSSGSSSSSSSSGSKSSSYASAASYSGSGSKGQQIANYACQFIGNPYVPGGTSLTEGADCSGFVWRVYKDFGYSVPRTSYSLRSYGTEVSYSDAQPGDVVCYAGHVGLYIGNGQIVHASTQKTGIKITNATYKEILSVRRIV